MSNKAAMAPAPRIGAAVMTGARPLEEPAAAELAAEPAELAADPADERTDEAADEAPLAAEDPALEAPLATEEPALDAPEARELAPEPPGIPP